MAGQRWVRIDVDYLTNPKVTAAGHDGQRLHFVSILWSARHLTDGHIPASTVSSLIHDSYSRRVTVARVVDAGLWVPNGDGFNVHDFTEMQHTREEVERQRERWRANQRRFRNGVTDDSPMTHQLLTDASSPLHDTTQHTRINVVVVVVVYAYSVAQQQQQRR